MIEKDLKVLEESLNKKAAILEKLHELGDKQSELLTDPSMSMEDFDKYMDEQDVLVGRLVELDEGFDALYESLKESMPDDKIPYMQQITRIQELVGKLMSQTELLSKKEAANKEKLTEYFNRERKTFGVGRRSSKAALDYYKSMSGSNVTPSYFMDQKQ